MAEPSGCSGCTGCYSCSGCFLWVVFILVFFGIGVAVYFGLI